MPLKYVEWPAKSKAELKHFEKLKINVNVLPIYERDVQGTGLGVVGIFEKLQPTIEA